MESTLEVFTTRRSRREAHRQCGGRTPVTLRRFLWSVFPMLPGRSPKADLVDLSGFEPKQVVRPDKQNMVEAAAKSNFKSRESKPALATVPAAAPAAIADANSWVLGEAFEKAVELLKGIKPKAWLFRSELSAHCERYIRRHVVVWLPTSLSTDGVGMICNRERHIAMYSSSSITLRWVLHECACTP